MGKISSLVQFAAWDEKTSKLFGNYLLSYESTPSSKLLLSSMIKFEAMYRPLKPGPFHVDLFNVIDGLNEERSARRARIYLNKKDLVKVSGKGGGKSLVLTTRAHKVFYEDYPLAALRKYKWDGFWTIVTYDLPNLKRNDRDYFRRKLKGLGFGCPQESLYVCPLPLSKPLRDLVEGERLGDFVWVLRAETVMGLENGEVAARSWNLAEFNDLYAKLLAVLPLVKKSRNKELLLQWQRYFLSLDLADPYLPGELLPADWQGEECRKAFSRLGFFGLLRSIFRLS